MRFLIFRARMNIVLRSFRKAIILLVFTLIIGTILFYVFYDEAWDDSYSKNVVDAFFGIFELEIGENVYNYPPFVDDMGSYLMRFVYLIYPIIGTLIIAVGLIEVGIEIFKTDINEEKIRLFRNHTIVIGTGHIGRRTIEQLETVLPRSQLAVLDLEKNEDFINHREKRANFGFISGDATLESSLEKCGILHARRVIIVTSDDLTNLKVAIKSFKLNKNVRTVLRIYDEELAKRLEEFEEVNATISTSRISAPYFVASAISNLPQVKYAFRTGVYNNPRTVFIAEFTLTASYLAVLPRSVEEFESKYSSIVMQLNTQFSPDSSSQLNEFDTILVLGELTDIQKIVTDLNHIESSVKAENRKHTIVVGCGHVGQRIIESIEQLFPNHKIIAIDNREPTEFLSNREQDGHFSFVLGNALNPMTLKNAEISSAQEIIIATAEDIKNLHIAIKSKKINKDIRTIVRTYEETLTSKVSSIQEVEYTISSSEISAPFIVTTAISDLKEVKYAFRTNDQLLFLAEYSVSTVTDTTLTEIESKFNVVLIQLNTTFRPDLQHSIVKGDELLVFGNRASLKELSVYLADYEMDLDNLIIPTGSKVSK